jgi:hypothetical protein
VKRKTAAVESALLEYGRQCIVFGVQDEAALTLAGRDTDSKKYRLLRPKGAAKDRARALVIRRLRALLRKEGV